MPKSKVQLEIEIDHPEKCSNNITLGLDVAAIGVAVAKACGASCAEVKRAVSIPVEEGVTAQASEEKDYPA